MRINLDEDAVDGGVVVQACDRAQKLGLGCLVRQVDVFDIQSDLNMIKEARSINFKPPFQT